MESFIRLLSEQLSLSGGTSLNTMLIIYTKKLLNSDWLRKECSSSVTRVQITNGF